MRFLRLSLTGLFLVSLTLGLLAYAGQLVYSAVQARMNDAPSIPERRERVFAVNLVEARPGTEIPILTAYGSVESRRTLEVRARTGGTIVELAPDFENGGRVRRGQLLARIDPAEARFALDRAESDLTDARDEEREARRALDLAGEDLGAAEVQADLRQRAFTRQLDLEERGVGTAAAVEAAELAAAQANQAVVSRRQAEATAEARVAQAATRLARARTAFAEARKRLEDTQITAEFTGTLRDVTVVEGRFVSANEKLADLVDPGALDVAFRISTAQYARLLDAEGEITRAPVRVSLDVYGEKIETTGRITRDSASVGDGETGRLLFAQLDDAQGFKPGDFVTVEVTEPAVDDVVRLPATALGADGSVLALTGEDRLRSLPVTLVRRQGNDILVRGADLSGAEIVAERSPLLGPGIKVRPLRGSSTQEAAADLIELSAERRDRLRRFVETSDMPEAMRARLLGELDAPRVPVQTVERLERRMGG
ncbi:efflux RND transporter periplasmic adaptor subunit [Roseovarius aestuariivivens]|uniref:efflux RND transporter periplasmic adaptor subunit n=1 Tax=Roseovarius aestuariivivens TaxID=1888910 RepID=UPI00108173EA|nr:HlyD family efflux transporter periplasmic adaptor subunit [Roseovarius aestuariivivens]